MLVESINLGNEHKTAKLVCWSEKEDLQLNLSKEKKDNLWKDIGLFAAGLLLGGLGAKLFL